MFHSVKINYQVTFFNGPEKVDADRGRGDCRSGHVDVTRCRLLATAVVLLHHGHHRRDRVEQLFRGFRQRRRKGKVGRITKNTFLKYFLYKGYFRLFCLMRCFKNIE